MTTPYSVRNAIARSGAAKRQFLADPGAGGIVKVYPSDLVVVQFATAGARTLQAAVQVPVGTEVTAMATIAGVTLNGVAIAIGSYAMFKVTLTSASVNQWAIIDDPTTAAAVLTDLTDVSATITAAVLFTRTLTQNPTATRTTTLPPASNLVAAMAAPAVGDVIDFSVTDLNATFTSIVTANASGGTDLSVVASRTVAVSSSKQFKVIITNVITPAYTLISY